LTRAKSLLLADEMGLGKTVSVIGALNTDPCWRRVLIIAPKSLLPMWEAELERWLVVERTVVVATAKNGIPSDPWDVLLMNYDIVDKFRKDLDELGPFDALVCDEAHYLKNGDALRTRAILGNIGVGSKETAINASRKWFLTGSPILNNPIELYPLLSALDPLGDVIVQVRDIDDFRDRYCGRQDTPWGITYKGGRNLAELRNGLRSGDPPLMIRRTKAQVLQDLPDKRHQLLPLEDERVVNAEKMALAEALKRGAQREGSTSADVADEMTKLKVTELKDRLRSRGLPTNGLKADLLARFREHSASSRPQVVDTVDDSALPVDKDAVTMFTSVGSVLRSETGGRKWDGLRHIIDDAIWKDLSGAWVMGALAKARHATALEKLPAAIELLESATASHKVVAFAHHRDVQDAVVKAFGKRAVAFHGASTQEERADAVHRFQTDESVRLFCGSIRAAGVGITLTAASHVVFLEFDWSPMLVQQAEDRCHRVGQKSSVLVQYLFFRGTIDEHLASLLASKHSTVTAALDAPTGAVSWVLDFGKFKGETVADVAASNPEYLEWIVTEGVHIGRDKLTDALLELGYIMPTRGDSSPDVVEEDIVSTAENSTLETFIPETQSRADKHADFLLSFGKHKGKRLGDVPQQYLRWLSASGAAKRNFRLDTALRGLGASALPGDEKIGR
jgi:SNF2 family DNA or RNA helicase